MTQLETNRIARRLGWMVALGAISGLGPAAPVAAQTAYGQGYAAVLSLATGSQQLAGATLPAEGGMAHSDLDNVSVANTLRASTLNSITTGMADAAASSAQTSAEAAGVTLLNGLITARQVLGLASSYVNQQAAGSAADGSMLVDLVVNGVPLDGTPPPNTRIDLPGVGYVVLNEQMPSGNGVTASGITVNMIHLVLRDALTGLKTGEVVVGSATSSVAY
jgi:hypothetical protein